MVYVLKSLFEVKGDLHEQMVRNVPMLSDNKLPGLHARSTYDVESGQLADHWLVRVRQESMGLMSTKSSATVSRSRC
ncbi:uncharacterized protein K452DRAFT_286096 [Aplosporella prunicola CBS 121167]|uniref:Uncharacterized protein n=1 Tax=Aplosporella prunicola CBS 121167 TaxID=1176127 RepID=A0A6A6BGK3_9PEZI|nr:uncharacterized protein K452DRAFT_286096 [Aplosporella prunicola CBS 121167]KAF2143269.1 hypothetical protein K452DRAFT_286096 [Aplosporella prunicola CBS 121167]